MSKTYELLPPFGRSRRFVVTADEYDELYAALTVPVKPTRSIISGAELIRRLYGNRSLPTEAFIARKREGEAS